MIMSHGKITLLHTCPKCRLVTATTYQELDEKFGFRNMNKNSMRNQSYCRECRKKSAKK
jgi:hypothetical protein